MVGSNNQFHLSTNFEENMLKGYSAFLTKKIGFGFSMWLAVQQRRFPKIWTLFLWTSFTKIMAVDEIINFRNTPLTGNHF